MNREHTHSSVHLNNFGQRQTAFDSLVPYNHNGGEKFLPHSDIFSGIHYPCVCGDAGLNTPTVMPAIQKYSIKKMKNVIV